MPTWDGLLVAIFVAPGAKAPMVSVPEARAVAGQGLAGDRYGKGAGTFWKPKPDHQVTLIEAEALEAAGLEPVLSRRNLLTRGVPLNHLPGKRFRVGDIVLRGIRLCEPCAHLEALTRPGVLGALVHRGGLRAEILEGGTVRAGDRVVPG